MKRVLTEPIFLTAGLKFLSTSYAGNPGKVALMGNFLGCVRNIRVKNLNHFMLLEKQVSVTRFCIFYSNKSVVFWEEAGYRFAPFDNYDVVGIHDSLGEVFGHKAGVGETVEIIVDEVAIVARQGIGFGDGEAGASDGLLNT